MIRNTPHRKAALVFFTCDCVAKKWAIKHRKSSSASYYGTHGSKSMEFSKRVATGQDCDVPEADRRGECREEVCGPQRKLITR
jgi:hypothetical protein